MDVSPIIGTDLVRFKTVRFIGKASDLGEIFRTSP